MVMVVPPPQASSIQSLGVTCESFTVGHNPHKVPLTHQAVFLPRRRPLFLSERVIEGFVDRQDSSEAAQAALDLKARQCIRLCGILTATASLPRRPPEAEARALAKAAAEATDKPPPLCALLVAGAHRTTI